MQMGQSPSTGLWPGASPLSWLTSARPWLPDMARKEACTAAFAIGAAVQLGAELRTAFTYRVVTNIEPMVTHIRHQQYVQKCSKHQGLRASLQK